MIAKAFMVFGALFGYMWLVSDDRSTLYDTGKSICEFIVKQAEKQEITLHIHTKECYFPAKKKG